MVAGEADLKAAHGLLPKYQKDFAVRFTNTLLNLSKLRKSELYGQIMSTVNKLKSEEDMNMDEAIRVGVRLLFVERSTRLTRRPADATAVAQRAAHVPCTNGQSTCKHGT